MLAEVIPLRNLPRGRGVYTYKIPLGLERNFNVGQIVDIPFQKKTIQGVVSELKHGESGDNIREVGSVVNPTPFLGEGQLAMLAEIGALYGTPISTLVKMSLPAYRRKKFQQTVLADAPPTTTPAIRDPRYFLYKNSETHASAIAANSIGNTLILAPRIQNIREILDVLPREQRDRAIIWHSELREKEQFENWIKIRNGDYNLIVATRGGVFLPFFHLDNVIVDFEHDENHKHWDQAPRFNAKDIATILAGRFGAEYTEMSYSPSVEAYYSVHRRGWRATDFNFSSVDEKKDIYGAIPPVIYQSIPDKNNFLPFSTQKQIQRVATSVGEDKDIFILLNRKGFASGLICRLCGWTELCNICKLPMKYHDQDNVMKCFYCKTSQPVPAVCGRCASPLVRLFGPGIERIASEVKKMSEKFNYDIITIDSESSTSLVGDRPVIIVGTDAAMAEVRWDRVALIVYLGIDRELNIPEFNASERVWHKIREIQYRKNPNAVLILSANQTANAIFKSLLEPDRMYRIDLNARRKADYPPYRRIVKFFYGNPDRKITESEATALAERLKTELTKMKNESILIYPIEMHPFYYRGRYWQAIIIKFATSVTDREIADINRVVPDSWKIDFNPISLLSP